MGLEESGGDLGSRGEVDEGEKGLSEASFCALGRERREDLRVRAMLASAR